MNYPYYQNYPYQQNYYPNSQAAPDQLTQLRQPYVQNPNYGQNQAYGNGFGQNQGNNGIIWVQGEEGAKAYMVAPGNTVLLMDSENTTLYMKSCDGNGVPSMDIYDYTKRTNQTQQPGYVTRSEYEELLKTIEQLKQSMVKEDVVNG